MVGVRLDRLEVNLHREAPASCEDLAARADEGSIAPASTADRSTRAGNAAATASASTTDRRAIAGNATHLYRRIEGNIIKY